MKLHLPRIVVLLVAFSNLGVLGCSFKSQQDVARQAACEGALGAVRSGISNYYGRMALPSHEGVARYPTLAELNTKGTVMQHGVPKNPYSKLAGQEATVLDADAAGKKFGDSKGGGDDAEGWYYSPRTGEFWPATRSGKGL